MLQMANYNISKRILSHDSHPHKWVIECTHVHVEGYNRVGFVGNDSLLLHGSLHLILLYYYITLFRERQRNKSNNN